MRIRDICSSTVQVIGPSESVRRAAARMRDHEVGSLVVVDDIGLPVGIITDRDLVVRALTSDADPGAIPIEHVMSRGVETIAEDRAVEDAVEHMSDSSVGRLVVVDSKGLLTGLLSVDDVLVHVTGEVARIGSLAAERRFAHSLSDH